MRLPMLAALLLLLSAIPVVARASDADSVVARAGALACDKHVVILGELPSHGEARAFALKAEIVKALVKRCGFKALLFEAPIYDFVGLEPLWGKGTAQPRQLDQAIGKFWWARELGRWRQWLFQQAEGGHLALGGLDDQVSATSEFARSALPSLSAHLVAPEAAQACRASVERNLAWSYDAGHPFDSAEMDLLQRCTRDAALAAQGKPVVGPVGSEQVMAMNLAGYVGRQVESKTAMDRDAAMFRNLQWYLARLPADSKVIVWTATVHGSRQQGDRKDPPLGTLLQPLLGNALGVIGFTAAGGQSSMAGGPPKTLDPALPDSLERRALGSGADLAFLDKPALAKLGIVDSRLLGKFSRADWSTRFDGVIVVAEELPASFEARP